MAAQNVKVRNIDSSVYLATKWKSILGSDIWRDRHLYIMLIPFLAFYIIFQYVPMYGLLMAFQRFSVFKGISGSTWVGFQNFIEFFNGPFFGRILRNTLLLNIYNLMIGFPIPIILALLVNEVKNKYYKTTVQTLTYLPHFVSVVVIAGIITNFLAPSGFINIINKAITGQETYFLAKPEYFRTIYNFMIIWKESGFSAIIYISALCSIDEALYEAAKIDGASKFRQLLHVTLPGLMPTIAVMFILRVGQLLGGSFEAILLLYQPATYETSDVISTYVYRAGLIDQNYSLATTAGLFNGVIALILVFITNKISNKVLKSGL